MHFLDFWKLIVSKKWFYFNIFLHIFHKKHHLKPIQKSFKSLKIDSFQGLTPNWIKAGGFAPRTPLLSSPAGVSVGQNVSFKLYLSYYTNVCPFLSVSLPFTTSLF